MCLRPRGKARLGSLQMSVELKLDNGRLILCRYLILVAHLTNKAIEVNLDETLKIMISSRNKWIVFYSQKRA